MKEKLKIEEKEERMKNRNERRNGKRIREGERKEKYVLLFFCLTLLLAGCTQQDMLQGEAPALCPLNITSLATPTEDTATEDTDADVPTRAAGITGILTTSEIGFFMAENTAAHYAAVSNRKGTYKGIPPTWKPDTDIWLNNMEASLAVYYPYDATQPITGVLNLTAGLRANADGKERDFWCAAFKANSRTEDINLVLKQLYSRLTVTFRKSDDKPYTGTAQLTKVKLDGVYASATYSPTEKIYAPTGAEITAGGLSFTIGGATADNPVQTDLLLIPNAILTSDITLTATVDGKDMAMKITKEKLSGALAAGKQYTLTVRLLPTGLQLSSLKTTDWDNSPSEITGDATF